MPSGPSGGAVIIVPMVTGQRVKLSAIKTILAGEVDIRADTNGSARTIAFGDQANDWANLADGDDVTLEHPCGVDLSIWYAQGTTGDKLRIMHGGGF